MPGVSEKHMTLQKKGNILPCIWLCFRATLQLLTANEVQATAGKGSPPSTVLHPNNVTLRNVIGFSIK
jgi:hypothetical protein